VFDSIALARQLCSPLIGLYEDEDGRLEVDFVHHIAAQFVRSASEHSFSGATRILKPQALQQLHRGSTSVWYFEKSHKSTTLLQQLRSNYDIELGEYFEMAYGLWNALYLSSLLEFLDENQVAQATRLCNTMTIFLESGECLKWVEMAIIVNYPWGYKKLSANVVKALDAAEQSITSPLPASWVYSPARKRFFANYAYVIYRTGPWDKRKGVALKPDGFDARTMAAELVSLAQQWAHPYVGYKNRTDDCEDQIHELAF
jgi:hypothetical protein